MMPGAQRVIEYHLIARGACWGHAVGQEPIRLREGDLIVFPQGDAHVLSSAPGMRAAPDMSAFARPSTPLPIVYELGGGGPERARIVCGFLGCDERPYNPLLTALPPVIHLSAAGHDATTGWLGTLLNIAVKESGSARAGSENVLARLSELMFVEAIRRYLETLPPAQTGWLAGLRDPVVGQALAALHGEPSEPWTVERLARLVGLSRSVLAERFAEMVGQPPMQYLALWRMQLGVAPAGRRRPGRGGRRRGRLRIGSGVQPRVQEAGGPGSGDVAERQRPPGGSVGAGIRVRIISRRAPTPSAPLAHPARVSVAGARCKP